MNTKLYTIEIQTTLTSDTTLASHMILQSAAGVILDSLRKLNPDTKVVLYGNDMYVGTDDLLKVREVIEVR